MLQYEAARTLYESLKERAETQTDEEFSDFYKEFLHNAVEYAENRAAWAFLTHEARMEDDRSRSIKHDGYISMLGAVCRYLGLEEADAILPDRKTKGDFACYVALFLSLEQR